MTLKEKLENERAHSAFLERLLKALYGEGWEELTVFNASQCIVIRPNRDHLIGTNNES